MFASTKPYFRQSFEQNKQNTAKNEVFSQMSPTLFVASDLSVIDQTQCMCSVDRLHSIIKIVYVIDLYDAMTILNVIHLMGVMFYANIFVLY